jgi:hypothetical protein
MKELKGGFFEKSEGEAKKKSVNDYVDESVIDLQDTQENKPVNIQVNKKINENVYKSEMVFVRKPRRRKPVPMTYRLFPETIEKIDDLAMRSGMYVSEFLQAVLDRVLDSIEIK